MPKTCHDCHMTEDQTDFYATSSYCTTCHNRRMVSDRQKSHRKSKVNAYNNDWLKNHPEVNREAQRRWRARQRVPQESWIIPPDKMTVQEAMVQLGLQSRFRITQFIDQGRLRAMKERGQWLIEREDVERMANERQRTQPEDQQKISDPKGISS